MKYFLQEHGLLIFFETIYKALADNDGLWLLLYFSSLILIILCKKNNKNIYNFFMPHTLIFVLISIFPLFSYFVTHYFTSDLYAYNRMNWLFLSAPAISCAVMILYEKINIKERVTVTALLLLLLFLHNSEGDIIYNHGTKIDDELYYNVPKEAINIGDYIMKSNEDYLKEDKLNHIKVGVISDLEIGEDVVYTEPRGGSIGYDKVMSFGLRNYASPLEVYTLDDVSNIKNQELDYIICAGTQELQQEIKLYEFFIVYSTKRYVVFENNN